MEIIKDYSSLTTIKPSSVCWGDCFDVMHHIDSESIDFILCDLPYGTTWVKWDEDMPIDLVWKHYYRLIKPNGVIALTASQPFTTKLISSNIDNFKYELIWQKTKCGSFQLAKYMPMKMHENICIFYSQRPTYNPQMLPASEETIKRYKRKITDKKVGEFNNISTGFYKMRTDKDTSLKNPISVLPFKSVSKPIVPTQKPVELFEWLIKTYTNEGDTVLDNTAGSMTTAIACLNTNRKFICIEKSEEYFDNGVNRINSHL
jgi:site-specific DNA-methyltransferase (adenine-specific)